MGDATFHSSQREPDGSAPDADGLVSPTTLALADVEAIVRVLNGAMDEGLSTPMRRRAVIEGIARLIQADTWIWIRYRVLDVADPRPVPFDIIDGGYEDEAERGRYIIGTSDEQLSAALNPHMLASSHRTNALYHMFPPTPQNEPLLARYRALTGLDDFIVSTYPLGGQIWSGVALNRRIGRPRFTAHAMAIVHVMIGQLDFLHRQGINVPANREALVRFTARERQVLIFLLSGDSAKGIANKMRLSPYTVNDHISAIYRALNVRTRPELMKLFMSGGARAIGSDGSIDLDTIE